MPTTNGPAQDRRAAPEGRGGGEGRVLLEGQGARTRLRRWPGVLAWTLVVVELVLLATPPWFDLLNRRAGRPDLAVLAPFAIPPTVAALMAGVVGAVLASRRPRHPVGWLLLAMA